MKLLAMVAYVIAAPVAGAATVLDATYQVPTVTGVDELVAVKDPVFGGEAGARRLQFRLPEDLSAGRPVVVDLHEDRNDQQHLFVNFVGDAPDEAASCLLTPTGAHCLIHYRTPVSTLAETEAFLRAKYPDPAMLRRKLAVAAAYANEPAGVLSLVFQP